MDQTTPGSSETHNNQINPETPTNPKTSNTPEVPENEPDIG